MNLLKIYSIENSLIVVEQAVHIFIATRTNTVRKMIMSTYMLVMENQEFKIIIKTPQYLKIWKKIMYIENLLN